MSSIKSIPSLYDIVNIGSYEDKRKCKKRRMKDEETTDACKKKMKKHGKSK